MSNDAKAHVARRVAFANVLLSVAFLVTLFAFVFGFALLPMRGAGAPLILTGLAGIYTMKILITGVSSRGLSE